LRAFYLKNFALAAENFDKAGRQSDEKIKRTERQLNQDKLDAYQNWRLAGITLFNLYKFREAVDRFTSALSYVSKDRNPDEWAEIKVLTGGAKTELATRVEGEESQRLLSDSESEYREALTIFTRDRLPQEWARIQNNLGNMLQSKGVRQAGKQAVQLLAESVAAYRQALTIYTREQTPQEWASTQNNLGAALIEVGKRADDEQGARLLSEAVAACRQALMVRARDQSPYEWAMTQNVLGNALHVQSGFLVGEQSDRQVAEAVTAFRQALTVYTRDQLPQLWALTQNNLGNALRAQGELTAGEQGVRLMTEAAEIFKQTLLVYTREQSPQDWALTQSYLAKTYFSLQNWIGAADAYANVLELYPDTEESYQRLSYICHEILFLFPAAFELNRRWLIKHPDDLPAQLDFAEKHVTTGRFAEFEQRIAPLLANPKITVDLKVALRAIEIANLLALDKANQVPAKLDGLIESVTGQPAGFKVDWSFAGTLHFIGKDEKLKAHRAWLGRLFGALQSENRDAMLKALREVTADFKH
jgi:tetratricopeptide (TPR) repeat protein